MNNKFALRSLAMIYRQLCINDALNKEIMNASKEELIMKSLTCAKNAIKADLADGLNWFSLGNTYFNLYFSSSVNEDHLIKQCLSAYSKASNDPSVLLKVDFLYNYAITLEISEDYERALHYFNEAIKVDPTFLDAKENYEKLRTFLKAINDMVNNKGSLKVKRINALITNLNKFIGNHFNGNANGLISNLKSSNLITISELINGSNKEAILNVKVIASINTDRMTSSAFCVIDDQQTCAALTIYNMNPDKMPKLGDTLTVSEPMFKLVNFEFDNEHYRYKSIKVRNPLCLLINGRQLTIDHCVKPSATFKITVD